MRFAVLVLALVLGPETSLHAQEDPAFDRVFDRDMEELRTSQGLSRPEWNPDLARITLERARVLAAQGSLSHEDAVGRGPGLQAVVQGLPRGEYGEVLGVGASPDGVWRAWLASPPHLAVLREPGWATWASASVVTGETTVWVIRFWKP